MTKTPEIESAAIRKATVLSVGPTDPDGDCLERIFYASDWSAYTNSEWTLIATATLASALSVLGKLSIPIVFVIAISSQVRGKRCWTTSRFSLIHRS
jgi:hypothetical protein